MDILDFELSYYLLLLINFLLIITSIKLVFSTDLLTNIIISSIFSLLLCLAYSLMDAPDVAMTEASIGACLSTGVLLKFLQKINYEYKENPKIETPKTYCYISASIICAMFIVLLAIALFELDQYGLGRSSLSKTSKYYLENTELEIGIPSFVAAILASYRGYDTLGETSVILIAGISILLIFSKKDNIKK